MQADIQLLKTLLEKNHPAYTWYTPQDSLDYYFEKALDRLADSQTIRQYKNNIAWYVSKIKCGHTSVRSPAHYSKFYEQFRQPLIPLFLKAWRDSLVVVSVMNNNDSILTRGTIVNSINGLPANLILDSMRQFISADGNANNLKDQLISFGFPFAYRNTFDTANSYLIQFTDTIGNMGQTTVLNYRPDSSSRQKTIASKKQPHTIKRLQRLRSVRNYTIDTATSTAFLKLTAFEASRMRFFYKQFFKTIDDLSLKNVVIDLRENGGGNIDLSNALLRYLKKNSFTFADSVSAVRRNFYKGRYIHPGWFYSAVMFFTSSKKSDGRFHFSALENHNITPKKHYHFDGNIYVVQGGFTFSAAASLVSHLKDQQNVTLVGEETGGGYYGNSAVHIPVIKLPRTKVKISLPLYKIVMDSTRQKTGKGIMPDVIVGPSIKAIKAGVDAKMEKVKALIQEQN